ncbi:hypothetical protein MRX96_019645 [Rhipicephalus microplus]
MAGILFTIEQIELIRRLRASGITRDQVMMAFEQLDRLDMELGTAARNYMANREPPQLQNASSNDSATGDCGPHNGESVASPPTTTAASSGGGSGAKLPSELTIIPISANASPQGGNEEHGGYGSSSGGGGGGASSNMYPPGVVPMQYLMNPPRIPPGGIWGYRRAEKEGGGGHLVRDTQLRDAL